MAPRKKLRVTGPDVGGPAVVAGDIAADSSVAHSINAVPLLQKSVCQCVELMYQVRHGLAVKAVAPGAPDECETMSVSSATPTVTSEGQCALPEMDEHGRYPFPISDGGTFMVIAQRAQAERDWFLSESAALLHAAGLLSNNDPLELAQEYLSPGDPLLHAVCCWFHLQ